MTATATLGQLIEQHGGSIKTGPFGTTLKANEYSETGVPIISVGEVGYGSLSLRGDTPCAPAEVTKRLPEYLLETGDIVFGRKGAVDRSAWVKESENGWFLGSDGIRVRLPSSVDSRFVAYQFQSEATKTWLLQHASGSTMLSLNQKILARVPLQLPEIAEQHAIAQVLGALDDKIDANTRLIDTADKLSHTQFLSMVRTGGQLVPLSDTARFVNGKAFTKNASGTGRMVIRIAELNSGIGGSTVYNDIDVDDQHLARPGDLLFAWSGSLTLHRWFRPEGIVNQHIFKVMPQVGYPYWLVYELLRHKLEEFKSIAADKATTMGHIQRKHLDEPVAVPALGEVHKHNDVMTGLWERALAAEVENLKLIATRDTLLPQLMSGGLQAKDAEKVQEFAGV